MPLIWCSISAHGFGHAAQLVPVLNELGRRIPSLKAILRTQVPTRFFIDRLHIPWEFNQVEQDIGCVQEGPLTIDIGQTWADHVRFHKEWDRRLAEEEQAIRSHAPDLVISDISYLAIEASARVGVPCVALCSLSWDCVLEPFLDQSQAEHVRIIESIRQSYSKADAIIRPMPGIPLKAFRRVFDVGPIADPLTHDQRQLRRITGASADERTVLIGFGGIPLKSLPFDRLAAMIDYRFIISGPVPQGFVRGVSEASISLPFRVLLASCDFIVTKPGYSTIVEAVACRTPVIYVRRYNFVDEPSLIQYLHRYGRAVELMSMDFTTGRWEEALQAADRILQPREPAPAPTGASEAADTLTPYFSD